jgi:secreted trypsin-like serine protease
VGVVIFDQPIVDQGYAVNTSALGQTSLNEVEVVGYGVDDGANQTGADVQRRTSLPVTQVGANEISAGVPGQTTCHGDSGGPWFGDIDGVRTIVGVTSWGDDGATCNSRGHAVRVDTIMDFLEPIIDADLAGTLVQEIEEANN